MRASRRRTSSRSSSRRKGRTRQEIGREAFVELTWEWLEKTGRTIMGQYRRLGSSLDYSRERFTMDDDYVRAVMTFFVRLWDRGWIYRANRIVNWCPFHQTAISDLEVVHEEMDDTLFTIRYPFADGDGRDGVSIATVRPATILADVAVAVHPDDPRYRDAIGREVVVPYIEQRVPVIADERIDREFGTGALKVTPGHDPLDFEIGRDHGLPEPMAVGWDGLMSERRRRSRRLDAGGGGCAGRSRGPRSAASSRSASRTAIRSEPASAATRASSRSSRCSGGARWPSLRRLRSRRCGSAVSASIPNRSTASRSRRSRRRPTGASRGSCGGAISCRSGTAPTGIRP